MSVPPCQIWTCRSTHPGEIQAALPSTSSASAGAFNDLPMALMLPSFPIRISVVVSECSAPKATGLTLVIRSGFACSPEIILQIPSQSWIEHVTQSVANHLERQDGKNDGEAGEVGHPVGLTDILASGGNHGSPGRDLRADTK